MKTPKRRFISLVFTCLLLLFLLLLLLLLLLLQVGPVKVNYNYRVNKDGPIMGCG